MKSMPSPKCINKWIRDNEKFTTNSFRQFLNQADGQLFASNQHSLEEARMYLRGLVHSTEIKEIPPEEIPPEGERLETHGEWWQAVSRPRQKDKTCNASTQQKVGSTTTKITRIELQRREKWREEQQNFRAELIERCNGRCQLSKCDLTEILEAAHVKDYAMGGPSIIANGLLLRADLHLLFDRNHIGIHPETCEIRFSHRLEEIARNVYFDYARIERKLIGHIPAKEFLHIKFKDFEAHSKSTIGL